MKLKNWRHDVIDIAQDRDYRENPALSVLANAVELLNGKLIAELPQRVRLLEIGCGAHSLFKDRLISPAEWEGIDVIEVDGRGRPTVATRRASVEEIPWPDDSFDYVVSNQSIEHWYEYGVEMREGLLEIRRVLKESGKAVLNFPVHLHGNRLFLMGDFEAIDREFESAGLTIVQRTAVVKSTLPDYQGWKLCGFPDFLVKSLPHHEGTAYVVEYVAQKSATSATQGSKNYRDASSKKMPPIRRLFHYGLPYALWKVGNKLRSSIRQIR
jgi:SAM-dependent methyltransferase